MTTKKRSTIDLEIVRQLASVLAEAGLSEIEYATGDCRIRVCKTHAVTTAIQGAATTPAIAPTSVAERDGSPRAEAEGVTDHPGLLTAPMVGVVYTSPEPTAPPFVQIGDQVAAGDTVLLIEAMKVFNPIRAHRPGTIERIFVSSGMPVEYGEPLLLIS